jgi:hypothetical protein
MLVRSDSSELAVTTTSFGESSSLGGCFVMPLAGEILVSVESFFIGISVPLIEEVSLIGEVPFVENSLLEVLLADEKPLRGEASLGKLLLSPSRSSTFKKPFDSPLDRNLRGLAVNGAHSSMTCAFVPP